MMDTVFLSKLLASAAILACIIGIIGGATVGHKMVQRACVASISATGVVAVVSLIALIWA